MSLGEFLGDIPADHDIKGCLDRIRVRILEPQASVPATSGAEESTEAADFFDRIRKALVSEEFREAVKAEIQGIENSSAKTKRS